MDQSSSSNPTPKAGAGKVTLKYGIYVREVEIGENTTYGELKKKYAGTLRIPEEANAYNGTTKMSDDQIVPPNSSFEFIRKTGEKGSH